MMNADSRMNTAVPLSPSRCSICAAKRRQMNRVKATSATPGSEPARRARLSMWFSSRSDAPTVMQAAMVPGPQLIGKVSG
ncbi:Uncharacterised protein [Bordetella pertussis]|nr:Uncharacterised protein [Bordetella pertussis]CFM15296.1 Uncharacterised protein [Bordetella pertussis]CFM47178.1 Uncharacterised protein [Bordetella pertussis]CFN89240.1 Uncharacterised protein [Bordetella pertussis]CFO31199.1 Uncharacterised protein [Bordetella pertussis]